MNSPERQFNALTPDQEKNKESSNTPETAIENIPIAETETGLAYLGVGLEKSQAGNGQFVPKREQYADFINDKEVALPLQRDIAIAFLSGEPLLVDGGTSLGKTTTVRKMAAELGWEIHYANLNGATDVEDLMGRYIPNPHKSKPEDPEYIFADGKVTSGLRQEEGKTKIVILDEFNASAPNILIRLHEVLDALERGGDVILSEDASDAVPVNKERTKIIALMNPPGKGYFGREPIDPAQLRRWVYKKLPSELPDGTFSYSTDALFGAEPTSQNVTPDMFIRAREESLTPEQLQEVPGTREVLEKYKEFHKAAKELLKNRKVAEDQPQPFTFDDRMEPRRVRDFVLRFYTGDINETFQQALQYYYANKLESEADRKKLGELIRLVEYKPKIAESKRKGTEREEKTAEKTNSEAKRTEIVPETKLEGPVAEEIEVAIEKLGKENVFGPKEIEKIFGVRLAEVPGIPFSVEELERAEKLGQMLLLRVDKTAEGKPMSLEAMIEVMTKRWKDEGRGDLLSATYGWKSWIGEDRFTTDSPRTGWALVSRDVLPESLNKNYIEQTEVIIATLKNEVFKDMDIPEEYKKAIAEFESKKAKLTELVGEDWEKLGKELTELKISQMTRQTFPEIIYDIAVYYDTNNKRLLSDTHTWSASLDPAGYVVSLGLFGARGVNGDRWYPSAWLDSLGVSLSRRL
ncbi:AAA family ATPase [Patescibacteria group bacterium]|nr:AAA family ATPase [Patescibacteria group bacterium]